MGGAQQDRSSPGKASFEADPDTAPSRSEVARATGEETVGAVRRHLLRNAAVLIKRDPEAAKLAAEMGLVDRVWLDHPDQEPLAPVPPIEVVERFLERSVEQRPSRLSKIGLSAVQLVTSRANPDRAGTQPVTVLFTDLEGFTAYNDHHGDAAALALLDEHHKAAGPVVRQWHGRIVKYLGDGLLCAFADPESGVRAALELLGTAPEPLALRAGAHTGDAQVSRTDLIGHVVNVAARVTERARGGRVLVTAEVAAATGALDGVIYRRRRIRRLKGISEPVRVFDAVPAAAGRQG